MLGVEPSNGERLEVHRTILETVEMQFRKRLAQALRQRRFFRRCRVWRKLIIDADVEMSAVIDEARKRPFITADAGRIAFEIEDIALLDKLAGPLRVDGDIDHKRA